MKMIERLGAQGDVMFVRVSEIPADAVRTPTPGDRVVVAHSETGHDHEVHAAGLGYYVSKDPLVCYLRLEGVGDATHLRSWDTHETLRLTPGTWMVRGQREYTPEGYRRVED